MILAGNPATIVDIGAGTGRFALAAAAAAPESRIIAVEPSEQMRSSWAKTPDNVEIVAGSAEATSLADAVADRIVWPQSFHWVDPQLAGPEALRILKPSGFAVVLANQLDVSRSWVHRLSRIMRSGDVVREERPPYLRGFRTSKAVTWTWEQQLSVPAVLSLARTRSSYLRSSARVREQMQNNLYWYLCDFLGFGPDGQVTLPYFTYLWRLDADSGSLAAG